MLRVCLLLLLIGFDFSFAGGPCMRRVVQGAWPMPDSVVGFWPLQADTQLDDIANNNCLESSMAKLSPVLDGPFGEPHTSFSVKVENSAIGYKYKIGLPSSFTLSFYLYMQGRGSGGIFMFWPDKLAEPRFSINYRELWGFLTYLEIWGGPEKATLIGRFPILQPKEWNFIAITYENNFVSIYDEDGFLLGSSEAADILEDPTARINVGYSFNGETHDYMKTNDAISCLMLYSTVLEPWQIRQLPYHCQTKGLGTTGAQPTTTAKGPSVKPSWPRQESLLGFWPLDSQTNFFDVGPFGFNGAMSVIPEGQLKIGPFGDKKTAIRPQAPNEKLFQVKDGNLSVVGRSFTVSLFFRRGADSLSGGIFEFLDKSESGNTFQFGYSNPTAIEASANDVTIGTFEMIQQKGAWTFLAFVYDSKSVTLTVYGKHGVILPPTYTPQLKNSMAFNNNGVRLGYSTRFQQGLQIGDALSCLMIYSAALTSLEIRKAYDSCRIMHGSAPCGVPKVFLPDIPSATTTTAMASPGQFPFVASLRSEKAHCSASIIDEYWLVTSISCFVSAEDPISNFKVYVGEHDLIVPETYTRQHTIAKIIPSGASERDIALIQVAEPIDLSNEYVNDACLLRDDSVEDLELGEIEFVYGWGKNGRMPFIRKTLPRYVPGQMMSDEVCTKAWGVEYVPSQDLCFTASSTDKDVPCSGDEGSPLFVQVHGDPSEGTRDRLMQVGVYYKRDENCSLGKPGIFANIAQFTDWITEKIACAVPGVAYPAHCPQH